MNVPSFFIRSGVSIRRKWTKISSLPLFPSYGVSFFFEPHARATFPRLGCLYRDAKSWEMAAPRKQSGSGWKSNTGIKMKSWEKFHRFTVASSTLPNQPFFSSNIALYRRSRDRRQSLDILVAFCLENTPSDRMTPVKFSGYFISQLSNIGCLYEQKKNHFSHIF